MKIWIALKESVKIVTILWQITEICSNQGFPPEPKKNYRPELQVKSDAETVSSWSHDMEGHAKKCVERYCELAMYGYDQQFKEEENESVGKLSTVCSQNVLTCLHLARIALEECVYDRRPHDKST